MIKCKPERNPKKAVLTIGLFVAISLLSVVMVYLNPAYKWIYQLSLIIILCIGINIVIRYTLTEMEYTLTENSFEVRKKVGNKVTLVCSLALSETVALVDKKTYKSNSASYGYISRKYNFNQNIGASSAVYICNFNGKNVLVEFEPNTPFYVCFQQKIKENKK